MLPIHPLSFAARRFTLTLTVGLLTIVTGCQHARGSAPTGAGNAGAPSVGSSGTEYEMPGVQAMDAAELGAVRSTRIEDVFGNRFAGLQVRRTGTGAILVLLRGVEPLVVVNGLEGDSRLLWAVLPQDIRRIEVLKDIGETAIYGNRGINGVVRVTTRVGR